MATITAYLGDTGLIDISQDSDAIGYPRSGQAKQWAADKVKDYAYKNGLRLVHGYEAVARSVGDLEDVKNGITNLFHAAIDPNPVNALVFAASPTAAPATPAANIKYTPSAKAATIPALFSQIMYILPDLSAAGFPNTMATTYAIAQFMLESDWMNSHVAKTDNNYSGITYLNKPYQKATKGLPKPASDGGGNYAHFASFKDWAKDFLRILSLNTGGQGRPIDAITSQQFAERLKANHYATDPNYSSKFNAALKRVSDALAYGMQQDASYKQQAAAGQDTFTYTAGEGLTSNTAFNIDRVKTGITNGWDQLATWQKFAVGITGTGLFIWLLKD